MIKRLVLINLLLICAVVAATATVTYAYFSSTRSESLTINTARIGIDETWNFPLKFANVLPGQPKDQVAAVRNTGSTAADFYLQMEPGKNGQNGLCDGTHDAQLQIKIEAIDANGGHLDDLYQGSICRLVPLNDQAVIPLLANNVAVQEWRYFRFTLQLDQEVSDPKLMDGTTNTPTRLIAVQHGGPAPQPAAGLLWPEGDPKY